MNATSPSENRTMAATGTIALHTVIVILAFLMIKGCGSGGDGNKYMALSLAALGDYEQGQGDPTENPGSPAESAPEQPKETLDDQVETQEEAPVVAQKPTDKPKPKPTNPTEKPAEKPKPSDALNNALNQLNKPGESSGETKPGANEGATDGSIKGKGVFSGGGGTGNWSLSGRNIRSAPSLSEKPSDEGKVVVDIWVDKNGNVVKAEANASNSNTSNFQLFALAEKAAKSAKFTPSEAANQQKGTITIVFKLQ